MMTTAKISSTTHPSLPNPEAGKETHPSLFKRFQETQAYHRIETEAFTLSNRLVDEASPNRKEVLLPAAIRLIRGWLEKAVSGQRSAVSQKNQADR